MSHLINDSGCVLDLTLTRLSAIDEKFERQIVPFVSEYNLELELDILDMSIQRLVPENLPIISVVEIRGKRTDEEANLLHS